MVLSEAVIDDSEALYRKIPEYLSTRVILLFKPFLLPHGAFHAHHREEGIQTHPYT